MVRGALSVAGVLLAVVIGISVYPAAGSPPVGTPAADHHGKPARGPHLLPFGHSPAHRSPQNGSAPAGAHLVYNGGRVASNIQVVQVIYGAGTYLPQTTSSSSPSVSSFYAGVTNSPYFDWLTEYNTNLSTQNPRTNQVIGRGTFGSQFTITPSAANNGSTIQDSNIAAELQAQIGAGHLPQPTTDAAGNTNTLYAIFFRNGQTICSGGSCSLVVGGFCAYHATTAASGSLPELYYSVHPDLTGTGGCGGGTDFQNTTSVASHEMIETVTDGEVGLAVNATGPPLAWYDQSNGEIGDICNAQQGTVTGGDGVVYTVQKEFSNVANDCIVTRSTSTNDFSIAASPTSLTLAQGSSGTATISTAVTSGSAQSVSLSVSGVPSGASASLSPTSVTAGGSSTLSVNAGTAAAGTYTLTITGTGSSATHAATVTLGITGSSGSGITNGGFENGLTGWTAGGASVSVATSGCHSGAGCAMLGATTPTNGDSTLVQTFTAPAGTTGLSLWYKMTCPDTLTYDWASVTLRDNTAGTTATPLARTCTTNAWSHLTGSIIAGHSYTLTLLSHDDNYGADPSYTLYDDVALTGSTVTNDFSIAASPASISVAQGSSGSSTISTAVTSGSAQTVSLSVSGAPSGATASLSPTSVTAGGSSTLSVNVGSTTAAGTYTLTITGTGSSATHSTTVSLTVPAPITNDFSISASPASLTLAQGSSGTSTISTAVTSGSAQSVSLSVSGVPSGATASLSPTSVTAGGSSTLSVNAGTAAAGTYTLTITGTGSSATHSSTVAVSVTAPSGGGITNGGFESGLTGWTAGGASATTATSGCHSGSGCAMLGRTTPTNGDSTLAQTFTAPVGTTGLSFWYRMTCPDTVTYDWASVTLRDNTAGTTATPLARTCTTNAWTQVTGSITAGHSYTLTLLSHDDNYGADPSYTLYDDVALTSGGPPPPPPPSGGITNGGFESGLTGWTAGGASATAASSGCHSGAGCAMLGRTTPTNGDSTLAQTFTAPAGTTGLSLWDKMTCPDTVTYDWATVSLRDNTAGTTATPLGRICTTNGWTQVTVAVTAGHSYTLTLLSHDDNYGADPSYTLYDDVALS